MIITRNNNKEKEIKFYTQNKLSAILVQRELIVVFDRCFGTFISFFFSFLIHWVRSSLEVWFRCEVVENVPKRIWKFLYTIMENANVGFHKWSIETQYYSTLHKQSKEHYSHFIGKLIE